MRVAERDIEFHGMVRPVSGLSQCPEIWEPDRCVSGTGMSRTPLHKALDVGFTHRCCLNQLITSHVISYNMQWLGTRSFESCPCSRCPCPRNEECRPYRGKIGTLPPRTPPSGHLRKTSTPLNSSSYANHIIKMNSKREESIQKTLQEFKSGKFSSLRATSKAYKIPLSTLADRNAGRPTRQLAQQNHQRLTPKEEGFLVEWIIEQDNQGFPPTHIRTREMAERILRIHDDSQPLGEKWVTHFIQRHPDIASCIGRKIDAKRIQG